MKHIEFYLVIVCTFISINITAQVLPPSNPNWEQVFIEEFDSLGVDTAKVWSRADYQMNAWNWYDSTEMDCFEFIDRRTLLDTNLYTDTSGTGKVILRVIEKDSLAWVVDKCNGDTLIQFNFDYLSPAMLESKLAYKYGYFEIRSKIPYIDTTTYTNQGIGPNFWLFHGSFSGPPRQSEIDVYEYFMPWQAPRATPTFGPNTHLLWCISDWSGTMGCDAIDMTETNNNEEPPLTLNNNATYNTYAAKWDPEKIEYYFNGNKYFTSTNKPDSIAALNIVLDINVIHWPCCRPTDSTLLPYNYEIDYVRVFQLKQYCDSDLIITSFNPSTFDYALYKTITLGNGTNSFTMTSGTPVVLLSKDGFTINTNTEISLGTELTLDFETCQDNQIIDYSLPKTPDEVWLDREKSKRPN